MNLEMLHISKSITETEQIAQQFLQILIPQEGKATIVGLSGDLGAGKTAFTQVVARILGIKEIVTSPTFIIEKIYKLDEGLFEHLIHIDAYRLESGDELLHLGWKEISSNSKNLIFIEWPEKVANILPDDAKYIEFKFVDETTREIKW